MYDTSFPRDTHSLFSSQGSSFMETTRDCLLRFATLTKTIDRQDGAHHGRRTFCSPFKQATLILRSSLQRVIKSPHFMWQRRMNRRICSVVNMDIPSRYSPLTPFSLKVWRYPPRFISSNQRPTSSTVQIKKSSGSGGRSLLISQNLQSQNKKTQDQPNPRKRCSD